jgi:hypothetical protein
MKGWRGAGKDYIEMGNQLFGQGRKQWLKPGIRHFCLAKKGPWYSI